MSTHHSDKRVLYLRLQEIGGIRIALIITLAIVFSISGLLTITFANQPGGHPHRLGGISHTTTTPPPIPTSTSLPIPSPSPTGPLPPTLSQAIATLQAQDRLLYSGNQHLPEIALTFDDGPNPYYTPQILKVLQQYGVKATFFCIGRLVAAYPALVQQEYAAGHVIGNHTWSHPDLAFLSTVYIQSQLLKTSAAIQAAIGIRPLFFRPPYGIMSVQALTQAYHLGLTSVLWNDEGRDWSIPGVSVLIQRILGLARNGAIILLHDGGGDRSQTVAALPIIIKVLKQRGFQFVTIQQLMTDLHKSPNVPRHGTGPVGPPVQRHEPHKVMIYSSQEKRR